MPVVHQHHRLRPGTSTSLPSAIGKKPQRPATKQGGSSHPSNVYIYNIEERKMAGSAFERVLQALATLLLAGLVVVGALLLVELRRMTDSAHGVVVRLADGNNAVDVSLTAGSFSLGTGSNPLHFIMGQ